MPQQIEFEGVTHEFPDDFTKQDIAKALARASDPRITAFPSVKSPIPSALQGPPGDHSVEDYLWNYGLPNVVKGAGQAISGKPLAGAHTAFTGVSQVAAPFALPAMVTAPAATLGTLAAGEAGNLIGRGGAEIAGASPDAVDVSGDVGGLLGGGLTLSPKVQAFFRGAGRAVPEALAGGPPTMGITTRILRSVPTVWRGAKTTAGDHPLAPPFITDLFNPPSTEISGAPSTLGLSNIPKVAPPPVDPIDTNALFDKQFGREPRGPVLAKRPAGPSADEVLAKIEADKSSKSPRTTSRAGYPSGYDPDTLDAIAKSLGSRGKFPSLSPSEQATILKFHGAPITPPPMADPLESQLIAPDVAKGPATPGKFEATLKGHQSAKAQKIQNIHDFLTTAKHDYTPEKLIEMDRQSPGKLSPAKKQFLSDAYDWSKANNRPVPKSGYTSLNLQETRPGYEGQGTLQDVLDLMQGKQINPMHMPLKDPYGLDVE